MGYPTIKEILHTADGIKEVPMETEQYAIYSVQFSPDEADALLNLLRDHSHLPIKDRHCTLCQAAVKIDESLPEEFVR